MRRKDAIKQLLAATRRLGRARVYVRRGKRVYPGDTNGLYIYAGLTRIAVVREISRTTYICARQFERVFGVKVPADKLLTLEISPAKVVKVEELT